LLTLNLGNGEDKKYQIMALLQLIASVVLIILFIILFNSLGFWSALIITGTLSMIIFGFILRD